MNTDTIIQNTFTTLQKVKWRNCESDNGYEWYYAENMLYVIRSKATGAYWFIKAKSPDIAYECVRKKTGG